MISVPCDLCNSEDNTLLFDKEGFRHVRCSSCGLVFVNPRRAEHLENQRHSGTGAMGENHLDRSQLRRLDREVARLEPFRKLNRLLEVGPGKGWFLGQAKRAGWETWAVEISISALARLEQQGHSRIIVETAEDFDAPPDYMDVVRMWDVIEHLRHPRKAVTNAFRLLRPGGLLTLATTNFASLSRVVNGPEWVYLNGSDHIFLFEPETMRRLLAEVGFSDVRIRTRSFNLRRKLYHPEKDLPRTSTILSPLRKIIDEAIRFTVYGHQMIVTAVKPNH